MHGTDARFKGLRFCVWVLWFYHAATHVNSSVGSRVDLWVVYGNATAEGVGAHMLGVYGTFPHASRPAE